MKYLLLSPGPNGENPIVPGPGFGFCIEPAGAYPGDFPVTVRFDGNPATDMKVASSRPMYFDQPFGYFEVLGLTYGETWGAFLFQGRGDGVGPSNAGAKQVVSLAPASYSGTALPTALPTAALPPPYTKRGFKVYNSWSAITFIFSGVTPADIELWVQPLSVANGPANLGYIWYLAETFSAADRIITRPCLVPGGRLYLRDLGAGQSVHIDVEARVL